MWISQHPPKSQNKKKNYFQALIVFLGKRMLRNATLMSISNYSYLLISIVKGMGFRVIIHLLRHSIEKLQIKGMLSPSAIWQLSIITELGFKWIET